LCWQLLGSSPDTPRASAGPIGQHLAPSPPLLSPFSGLKTAKNGPEVEDSVLFFVNSSPGVDTCWMFVIFGYADHKENS
jgi:hypothetical protein